MYTCIVKLKQQKTKNLEYTPVRDLISTKNYTPLFYKLPESALYRHVYQKRFPD